MYQIKEFYTKKWAELPVATEAVVNEWLQQNPDIEILQTQYFMAGDGDLRFVITYTVPNKA